MTFGEIIQPRRKELGMSPNMLAREAGVATFQINNIEDGQSASDLVIWKIGRALGFDDETIQQLQHQFNG